MKLAVAGKGGSGKTSVAGTLARLMARRGLARLVAVDADSNPNLALTLGLPRESFSSLPALPRTILKRDKDEAGRVQVSLADAPEQILTQHGIAAPDGITLLLMGCVEHAGGG